MKPILVYINEKENTISLTKEQLEEIIVNTYNAGFEDGSHQNIITYPWISYQGNNSGLKPPYEITCNDGEEYKIDNSSVSKIIKAIKQQ